MKQKSQSIQVGRRDWFRVVGGGVIGTWALTNAGCSDPTDASRGVGEGLRALNPEALDGSASEEDADTAGTDAADAGDANASDAGNGTNAGDANATDATGADAADAADAAEAAPTVYVTMYDTYAMALYFDGGLGPKTGTIKVDDVIAGTALTFDFWHGHNNVLHKFTVTPADWANLKKSKKVMIQTTEVDNHSHALFIDPNSPMWRVPGAPPRQVPV